MRGVPPRSLRHLHGDRRIRRNVYGLAVVLAGAVAGYGGDRRWPVTGVAVRRSRRAVGLASEGRGEKLPPRNGQTPGVNPGRLWRVYPDRSSPLSCSRPSLAVHGL